MMNRIASICQLGKRLSELNEQSPVVQEAVRANPWFLAREVVRAAHTISRTMLERKGLEQWMKHYPTLPVATPRCIRIVMAGNIPLVGFFDLLCVVLAGHRALVKPSSKDRVLMEWVVGQLQLIDPSIPVAMDSDEEFDALIATGSDEAVRHFRSHYPDKQLLLRGNRSSVAVLTGEESEEELQALADDLFAYSGLGCRNISMVLAPEGYGLRVTVPPMNPLYEENYRHRRALLRMQGAEYCDLGGALLREGEEFSAALCEIALKRYRNPEQVSEWIEAHRDQIQCIVGRHYPTPLGGAQAPSLTDYADGIDTMQWLQEIV